MAATNAQLAAIETAARELLRVLREDGGYHTDAETLAELEDMTGEDGNYGQPINAMLALEKALNDDK